VAGRQPQKEDNMTTYTQLFYNRFCGAPREWLSTKDAQELLSRAEAIIRQHGGDEEAAYFAALMSLEEVLSE